MRRILLWAALALTLAAPALTSSAQTPRHLTAQRLAGVSAEGLRLMRNEVYARHGYRFGAADLRAYFSAQPWYRPDTDDSATVAARMTPREKADVALIARVERQKRGGALSSAAPPPPSLYRAPPFHRTARASRPAPVAPQGVKVWVNTASGVYHFPGQRWYGATAQGEFMTETEAVRRGYRPTRNGQ